MAELVRGVAFPLELTLHRRSEAKRNRILDVAARQFAQNGFHGTRVVDIANALGIAKGSVFQHFASKEGLFLEVYKRATRCFPRYLDAPVDVRQAGVFEIVRHLLARTQQLIDENWIPYRIVVLGNHGTGLALRREINRFLLTEDPYGTRELVQFGLDHRELSQDLNVEIMIVMIDWIMDHFQNLLLMDTSEPARQRRPTEISKQTDDIIIQLVTLLRRAVSAAPSSRACRRTAGQNGRG